MARVGSGKGGKSAVTPSTTGGGARRPIPQTSKSKLPPKTGKGRAKAPKAY